MVTGTSAPLHGWQAGGTGTHQSLHMARAADSAPAKVGERVGQRVGERQKWQKAEKEPLSADRL